MTAEIRNHEFFKHLTAIELEELLVLSQVVLCPKGKPIFLQGDESDCMYFIISGRVKISMNSQVGKETVLDFIGKNMMLGELGVLDGQPRSATATALEHTRALYFPRTDFLIFIAKHPEVAMQIISVITQRIRDTNNLLESIVTLPGGERLARTLLRLGELYGTRNDKGHIHIDLKLTQSNLGSHIGLKRENVNRQLKTWQRDNIVNVTDGFITIFDTARLQEIQKKAG